ncbi:MAG: hypothetical protein COY39_03195 [Alphaproteobacteria bacterium CG_4_10_14_0_8_um_filter_37_21]|nr:MAG: hypothetical protein COY39_03195 [Alphaproteobacteria bacterium CG_4_10_14_0_8_um_filter_37_21]
MSTYKILKNDTVLLSQPYLIDELGRTGAQFLNQIHYWLEQKNTGINHNNHHWVYNTAEEWAKQLRVSVRSIRRYINLFLEKKLIQVQKLSKHKSNRTNYITINYEALHNLNTKFKSDTHRDKVAPSCGQNGTMVIQKITNKELNNKSIKDISLHQKQAKQVDIIKNSKTEEKKEAQTIHNTTVQDMLKFWNDRFLKNTKIMNKDLAKQLMAAFKYKCNGNLRKWENYLDRLQSSTYIMSETFKLTLSWALKFKTMDRIFESDLGVQDIPIKADTKTEENKAVEHITTIDESQSCKNIRSIILKKFGALTYNAWFTKVIFVDIKGDIKLKAQNKFVEDYVLQHFGSILNYNLSSNLKVDKVCS